MVDVEVHNLDDRPLEVTLGFLVRPGEDELVGESLMSDFPCPLSFRSVAFVVNYLIFSFYVLENWIMVDRQRSASLIKDVELGVVEPGGFVVKKVILVCTGVRGERVVDVQVLTRVVMGGSDRQFLLPSFACEELIVFSFSWKERRGGDGRGRTDGTPRVAGR